jgi:hypothetical protein
VYGEKYDDFVDKFVRAAKKHYPKAYIHFEDFGLNNARRILDKYTPEIACFNDDVQGTGCVTLAAIMAVEPNGTKLALSCLARDQQARELQTRFKMQSSKTPESPRKKLGARFGMLYSVSSHLVHTDHNTGALISLVFSYRARRTNLPLLSFHTRGMTKSGRAKSTAICYLSSRK